MRSLRTILVPVDFSPESRRAIMHASALAQASGARLRLLYVHSYAPFDEAYVVVPPPPPPPEGPLAMLLHQLVEFAAPVRASSGPLEVAVRGGEPIAEILKHCAERPVELIITATTDRPDNPGSVVPLIDAERLAREADVSVLLLKTEDESRSLAPFSGVLCAVDLSDSSTPALAWSTSLARALKLELTVLHVVETEGLSREWDLHRAQGHVSQLLSNYKDADTWMEVLMPLGQARNEIVRVASSRPEDLLVLGAAPTLPARRPFIGATLQHVLHHVSNSVLVARSQVPVDRPSISEEREMVGAGV